jgi:hypothetical protein
MMKKSGLILVVLTCLSCGNKKQRHVMKPTELISKSRMVDIIYDMAIISAAKGANRKLMEQNGVNPATYVYDKFDIDSTQFVQSNEYYSNYVQVYEDIYNEVKLKLKKEKNYYNDLVKIENRKKDSINKERRKTTDSLKKRGELGRINPNDKVILDTKLPLKKRPRRLKNSDSLKQ